MESVMSDRVCLQFSVCDTGIGIPLDKQEGLFQEFQQAHTTGHVSIRGYWAGARRLQEHCDLNGRRDQPEEHAGARHSYNLSRPLYSGAYFGASPCQWGACACQ